MDKLFYNQTTDICYLLDAGVFVSTKRLEKVTLDGFDQDDEMVIRRTRRPCKKRVDTQAAENHV